MGVVFPLNRKQNSANFLLKGADGVCPAAIVVVVAGGGGGGWRGVVGAKQSRDNALAIFAALNLLFFLFMSF